VGSGALGNLKSLDIVTELVPNFSLFNFLELEYDKIDQKLGLTFFTVDRVLKSLADAMYLVLGLVTDLNQELIVRDSVTNIRFFAITLEIEGDENELTSILEWKRWLDDLCCLPIEDWLCLFLLLQFLELTLSLFLECHGTEFLNRWCSRFLASRHFERHTIILFLFEFYLIFF